jgi:hypothetical protein
LKQVQILAGKHQVPQQLDLSSHPKETKKRSLVKLSEPWSVSIVFFWFVLAWQTHIP